MNPKPQTNSDQSSEPTRFEIIIVFMVQRWNQTPGWNEMSITDLFYKVLNNRGLESYIEYALDKLFAPTRSALVSAVERSSRATCPIREIQVTAIGEYLIRYEQYPRLIV